MTRSSTNELFTPYKEPEREFRSSRRHLKTLSLDELRSPDFNLLSDEEYSEEEEEEEMAETMEQYMSKTRTDYGSGVARPKIDNKDQFILDSRGVVPTKTAANAKTFIKEMAEYSQKWHNGTSRGRSTETSDGLDAIQAQLNNLGREIKKVNENFYTAQVGCEQCKGPHYTKDFPLKEEGKTLEEAYYTQFGGPFQGGGYRATALGQNSTPLYKARQTTVPFPSRLDNHYCEEEGNYGPKFMEAYGASHINNVIPRKEKDPGSFTLPCFINDFCFDNALVDLEATVNRTVKYPKGIAENVLVGIGKFTFPVDFIILDMPEDIRVPLILGRPFLSTARAKIDVYKRKITLRVGEEKIIFKSVKPASSIIKRVYMLSLREQMELDLEARLMGETLVINRSLYPFLDDYIKLNDLNEPFELRRNQGDDLMPIIEEGEKDCFRMDDPSMTMEEYIKFEEEKARKRGKVFNWQTTTNGKIKVDDDLHNFSSVEAEFPAIVINDAFAPQDTF
ncbi:retrovirus-related pol polyprotein from transposon TNT 1-94 [Tanacetum coccineum]